MTQYIKTFVPVSQLSKVNTTNCYELAPFRYSETEKTLYLTEDERERIDGTIVWDRIKGYFPKIAFCPKFSDLEGISNPLLPQSPEYLVLYDANIELADAGNWYHLLNQKTSPFPNCVFLSLTKEDCRALINGNYQYLIEPLQRLMETIDSDVFFVKTSICSTKHDYAPRAILDADDAFNHLLGSKKVRGNLENGRVTGILVQPWKSEITRESEFRVFVRKQKVTGVSQQYFHSPNPVMHYLDTTETILAFQRLYDTMASRLEPKNQMRDCTFDSFLSTDLEGQIEAHLIEINSGALGWGPAGSSLFEWVSDPPKLPESGCCELRITG